jgi:PleD family two-component response regulator
MMDVAFPEAVTYMKYRAEYPRCRNQGDQVPDTNRVVFVVDDEAVIAQTLATILNQAGFQASAFDHPEQAIVASAELTPALLISDVMMPGMTGVELAIHFRKSHPECKVLLFLWSILNHRSFGKGSHRGLRLRSTLETRPFCGSSGKAPSLSARNQIFVRHNTHPGV